MFLRSPLGQLYPLDRPLCLGRDAPCQIRVPDELASRVHAALWPAQGRVYVRDEHSLNGTFVNGTRLAAGQARCLQPGDQVQVGQTLFTLVAAAGQAAPAPCPAERETVIEPAVPAVLAGAALPRTGPPIDPAGRAAEKTSIEPPPSAAPAPPPVIRPSEPLSASHPAPATAPNPLPPVTANAPSAPEARRPSRALAAGIAGAVVGLMGACAVITWLATPAGQAWVRSILGF